MRNRFGQVVVASEISQSSHNTSTIGTNPVGTSTFCKAIAGKTKAGTGFVAHGHFAYKPLRLALLIGSLLGLSALSQTAWADIQTTGSTNLSPSPNPLTGPGQVWNVGGNLDIGNAIVAGQLAINNGSVVNSSSGAILPNSSATASSALVTGAGSQWNNSGNLGISGRLNIINGGLVTSASAGFSFAAITINGAGSRLEISGLSILSDGNRINIRNNGALVTPALTKSNASVNNQILFNGGILRLSANTNDLFQGFGAVTSDLIALDALGGTIDTQGFAVSTDSNAVISGPGGLTKAGTGSLTMANVNTYTGATNINAGTLNANNAAALGNNSAVNLASGTTLNLGANLNIGSLAGAGDVALNSNTLYTGGNNTSTTFSGSINGTGDLIKEGTGTFTLTGISAYSGATNVNAGTLRVDNTSTPSSISANSAVTVASGATLDIAKTNGGTNVGALTLNNGSTLKIAAQSMSNYTKVDSTGAISLAGGLDIDVTGSVFTNGGQLNNVLKSATGLSGTFASYSDNSVLFNFTPVYDTANNAVHLSIAAVPGSGSGPRSGSGPGTSPTTPNPSTPSGASVLTSTGIISQGAGQQVGALISNVGSEFSNLFIPLTTNQQVVDAVNQTLPFATAGLSQLILDQAKLGNQVIENQLATASGLSSGDEASNKRFWLKGYGNTAHQGSIGSNSGYNSNGGGFVAGVDGTVLNDALTLGFAFGYGNNNVNSRVAGAAHHADLDSYRLIHYGQYALSPNTNLIWQADYSKIDVDSKRNINFANRVAKADYDTHAYHLGIGLNRAYALSDKTTIAPQIRADYTKLTSERYTEKGAGALNLKVRSDDSEELMLTAEAKLKHAINTQLNLNANFGAGYDAINQRGSLNSSYLAGGSTFSTQGLDMSPWLVKAGFGLESTLASQVQVDVRYDYLGREQLSNHTASVKVTVPF